MIQKCSAQPHWPWQSECREFGCDACGLNVTEIPNCLGGKELCGQCHAECLKAPERPAPVARISPHWWK